MKLTEISAGNGRRVWAVAGQRRCPTKEFLSAQSEDVQAEFAVRVETWINDASFGVEGGQWNSLKRGKDKIDEWHLDKHIRVVWFEHRGVIVITQGYRKNRQTAPDQEIENAVKRRRAYIEALKRGQLEIDRGER